MAKLKYVTYFCVHCKLQLNIAGGGERECGVTMSEQKIEKRMVTRKARRLLSKSGANVCCMSFIVCARVGLFVCVFPGVYVLQPYDVDSGK